MDKIDYKCQISFFISPLSGSGKQTTSVRFFFSLLYSKLKGSFSVAMMTPGST